MCGIIGAFNCEYKVSKIVSGLGIIKNRGMDCFGISDGRKVLVSRHLNDLELFEASEVGLLGHCLHSIVGYMPQPIQGNNSVLVANCEIYNWRELDEKYGFEAENDAEVLLNLLDMKGELALKELDGVFAFAYLKDGKLMLARDIVGLKPLWISKDKGFFFCSEGKALRHFNAKNIEELNPRTILIYDVENDKYETVERDFFSIEPQHKKDYNTMKKEVLGLVVNAIAKRIPDQKIGILFSGGLDSTIITLVCKKLGVDFTCYTAAFMDDNSQQPEDLSWAKEAADTYGFELKVKTLNLKDAEDSLKIVIPLIEDNNVVKVGVGLTFYAACEMAKMDGVRVIFSGLGSEEIFAGYDRHKKSADVNMECLSGLRKIYERDTYRDDVITMNNNMELRAPFLDKDLCDYALKIPGKYKIADDRVKIILRDVAKDLGLDEKFAERKRRAAQYGSRIDRALQTLTKKNKFKLRSEYLESLYSTDNVRLGVMFSSGKDSCLAMHIMRKQNYKIECLITMKSRNPDSYMFHTPNVYLASLQAEAMEVPILIQETAGEKEDELKDLEAALFKAKQKYHIEGIVVGAI
ncbi:MAG: asparagine synthase-related protein, partial [Candidatus Woesearchaeota archaeon]